MKIIDKWEKTHHQFGYFCEGKSEQQGVIRTSCLDSLDRTNAFQSKVGWKIFMIQLAEFGPDMALILSEHSAAEKFKSLWVHNGNALSIQYSGTASTTAAITKNGKEGILGYLNHGIASVGRFWINNFEDDFKQQCIDIFLNRETTGLSLCTPLSPESKSSTKCELKEITMFIGTWNACGVMPTIETDFSKWLNKSIQPYFDNSLKNAKRYICDRNTKICTRGSQTRDS